MPAKQTNDNKLLENRIIQLENDLAALKIKIDQLTTNNDSTTKKSKKKSDSPKKPKPKTGYLIFSSENREKTKAELTKLNGSNPIPADVIRELGKLWKQLDQSTKDQYNTKAKQLATSH